VPCEDGFYQLVSGKSSFTRRSQPSIDSLELSRWRVVCTAGKLRVDFARDFCELFLCLLGPSFRPAEHVFKCFCGHGERLARTAHFGTRRLRRHPLTDVHLGVAGSNLVELKAKPGDDEAVAA
jgi:hypothetical protein